MSTLGKTAWNKGRKFPHSAQWEKRRIAAVRVAANKKQYPRGYRRPREHVEPMLAEHKKKLAENPEKYRQIAIRNLPKNVNGENNGNWKGGITQKTRGLRFTKKYEDWRIFVLERDGCQCKLCGATENLQVHHIIAVSECPLIATLPMNGVVLCRKCHYENDEAWQGKRFEPMRLSGRTTAMIFTIPHKFQAYETVGNWQVNYDGTLVIFVSELGDADYNFLVALHELVEVYLCQKHGVTQESVDKFDIEFEKQREKSLVLSTAEPGDDPNAPYRREHCFATGVERVMAAELGVCWADFEKQINSL